MTTTADFTLFYCKKSTIRQALNFLCEYTGPLKGNNRGGAMSITFYEAIKEFLNAETVTETISAANRNFEVLQKDFGKSLDDVFSPIRHFFI